MELGESLSTHKWPYKSLLELDALIRNKASTQKVHRELIMPKLIYPSDG